METYEENRKRTMGMSFSVAQRLHSEGWRQKRGFHNTKKKRKGDNQMLTFFSPTNESSLKLKLNRDMVLY